MCSEIKYLLVLAQKRWVLKAPPLKSTDLHFSVIKCNCRTYNDNIGPELKKLSFAILGAFNMFDKKFDQHGTDVCPEMI